jgi:serine/threonine protein kinase
LKQKNAEKLSVEPNSKATYGDMVEKAVVLGVGAFGRVLKARLKPKTEGAETTDTSSTSSNSTSSNPFVAIKEVNKNMSGNALRSLKNEIGILNQCCHGHILLFYEYFETDLKFCLITELCEGGELFDFIQSKSSQCKGDGRLNEAQVSSLMFSLLEALSYLQDKLHVAHRDIKPENILFKRKTPVYENNLSGIVLADFGFAYLCQGASLTNACGSTHFIAPEIHKGLSYDYK